jgi:hypothetical protein
MKKKRNLIHQLTKMKKKKKMMMNTPIMMMKKKRKANKIKMMMNLIFSRICKGSDWNLRKARKAQL